MTGKNRARVALRKSVKAFRAKVVAALPFPIGKTNSRKRRAHEILPGTLADDGARIVAGDALIEQLIAHHKRVDTTAARHFLVTFCWDAGLIGEGANKAVDLTRMKLKVYKALKSLGLHGIGVFELSPLRKTKFNPALLVGHFHAFAYTSDRSFKPKAAAKRLNARGAFPNRFGAAGVTIQSRKMAAKNFAKGSEIYRHLFSDLDLDQTKASVAWMGYYLLKALAFALQLCPRKHKPGQFVIRSNSTNYSPQRALELERHLNQISILDAVFSVGDGSAIGRPWRASFRAGMKKLSGDDKERRCATKRKSSKAKARKRRARLERRMGGQACRHWEQT